MANDTVWLTSAERLLAATPLDQDWNARRLLALASGLTRGAVSGPRQTTTLGENQRSHFFAFRSSSNNCAERKAATLFPLSGARQTTVLSENQRSYFRQE